MPAMARHRVAHGYAHRSWMRALVAVFLTLGLGRLVLAQVTVTVPATSNPYLAGLPTGSTCCSGDSAPAQAPVQVSGIPVTPGTHLTFTASGAMHFESGPLTPTPDGAFIFTTVSTNGISGATWTSDALVGVFLDNNPPNTGGAPAALDFSPTGIGVSFTTLSPALRQVFFIGDGRTGTGTGAVQTFLVPASATRLFLGASDGVGWLNNIGGFSATVNVVAPTATASPAAIPALSIEMLALLSLALIVVTPLCRRPS